MDQEDVQIIGGRKKGKGMKSVPPYMLLLMILITIRLGDLGESIIRCWDDVRHGARNSTLRITPYLANHSASDGAKQSRFDDLTVNQVGREPNRQKEAYNVVSRIEELPVLPVRHETYDCCLRPAVDMQYKLTPEYFEDKRKYNKYSQTNWTGNEYEEWIAISLKLNPNNMSQIHLDCNTQYSLLVLDQVSGYYLRWALTELLEMDGKIPMFPFHEEIPGLPRVLLLGDSISLGIRTEAQKLFHPLANIQGAPTNSLGFDRYTTGLSDWLGKCPWDLVQFNVGMHFHPRKHGSSWTRTYRNGIRDIVNAIKSHSPSAHIVIALTTPSPFDSNMTFPNKASCPHYEKFHKAGFVSAMNEIAVSVAKDLGVTINDRYSFILPVLGDYQMICDIHYKDSGYQLMAEHDWEIISSILFKHNSTSDYQ